MHNFKNLKFLKISEEGEVGSIRYLYLLLFQKIQKMQKRVTLSICSETYEEFQRYCEENDIILSKRVERLMKQELEKKKTKKEVSNEFCRTVGMGN